MAREHPREVLVFKVRERIACYDANGYDSVEQGKFMGLRVKSQETGPRWRQGSALARSGLGPQALALRQSHQREKSTWPQMQEGGSVQW